MKWNVGTKIGMGFGLSLVTLVAIGIISSHSTKKLTETADWVTHTHQVREELAGILQGLTNAETGQRGYLLTSDESYLQPYLAGTTSVDEHMSKVKDLTRDNPRQQQRLDKLAAMSAQRLATMKSVIEIDKNNGHEAAKTSILIGQGKKEMDGLRALIGDMGDEENTLLAQRSAEADASVAATTMTIWLGTIGAAIVLSITGFMITQNISKPLLEITRTAERIAAGDLSIKIPTTRRRDEVGVLSQTFQRMTDSLRGMSDIAVKIAAGDLRVVVRPQSEKDVLGNAFSSMVTNLQQLTAQMAEGVNILSSSANQISTSTTQLSASATETATAVSQATTTVEEVKQTAQLSTEKSKSVSDNAQKMAQISLNGARSTDETVNGITRIHQQMGNIADSMVRLSEQTQTIGQVVATVEDLAAQSSILAVNASIEAAKAGEQGKGFAVVAQEVRSLAEQSKQATDQVRNILSDIQKATSSAVMVTEQGSKAVEAGVKQAGEAGQSIQALSSSVTEAAQAATQIAASSQQQLVGVDQVASAMESIKQASAQNVASAKQLEASAHDLKELGQRLKTTVEKYRV